eukprot:1507593-Amphidinium_carterae.1
MNQQFELASSRLTICTVNASRPGNYWWIQLSRHQEVLKSVYLVPRASIACTAALIAELTSNWKEGRQSERFDEKS